MSSFASHNVWDLFTWICGAWNISLIAASTSDMPISLLPDCKSPWEDCNASLSEAFLGRSMETWLDIEGCERSSAISTARLQSSNARRASPDTAATYIHRATSFQPYCSPSSCLCHSHYSPFPCSASADLLLLTHLEERKIRYLFIIQKRKTQWYTIKRHQIWPEELQIWPEELLICGVSCKRSHQMIFHFYLSSHQSQILCSALSVWMCVCLSCTGHQCQHDNGKNTLREANSTACLSKAAMPCKRVARICCSCVWE